LPSAQPDVQALQKRVTTLLATEKTHVAELQRVTTEKEQIRERLENASYRYLIAEKKLDRSKSQAVANVEKQGQVQAQAGMKTEKTEEKLNGENANGIVEDVVMASEEVERERAEAIAVNEKTKEQLSLLEEQNSKLTLEVTTLRTRLDTLSDDDFAGTELFKIMKSQLEDSFNKLNDLEAIHIQLREEAKKAQAERTAYRLKLDEESRAATSEAESQLAKADADLQRIRAARDDLQARSSILEASLTERKVTVEQATSLAKAGEDRIKALEAEVERLQLQFGETHAQVPDELKEATADELRIKVSDLMQQYALLSNELPSMEQAWKKAQALASNKVAQTAQWEEQIGLLNAEKAKANQKYFAAMKAKEANENEVRSLRKQNKVSSGIISSLKDNEAKYHDMCTNLDKQIAEHKDTMIGMATQQQTLDQKLKEAGLLETNLKAQIVKLTASLSEKDSSLSTSEHSRRESEQEVEALKVKLEASKKKAEEWKQKSSAKPGKEMDELDLLRVSCNTKTMLNHTLITMTESVILPELQRSPQKHSSYRLWPYFLQRMRPNTPRYSSTQMPDVHEAIRSQRPYADPSCLDEPLICLRGRTKEYRLT
jgi:E3 ubiquitin-protein ligase BRE1